MSSSPFYVALRTVKDTIIIYLQVCAYILSAAIHRKHQMSSSTEAIPVWFYGGSTRRDSAGSATSSFGESQHTKDSLLDRTIDDFYLRAHNPIAIRNPLDILRISARRLPYFACFVALGLSFVGNSTETGSLNYLLENEGFLEEAAAYSNHELITSSLFLGIAMGSILVGPLCDHIGRRVNLVMGLVLTTSVGLACSLADSPLSFMIFRIFIGFGLGVIVTALLPLSAEHTSPTLRGAYLSLVAAFGALGSVYLNVIGQFMFPRIHQESWRVFVLLIAAPSAVALPLVLFCCPESARFLALKGRSEDASRAANRIAKFLGYPGDPITPDEIDLNYPPKISKGSGISSYWCIMIYSGFYRILRNTYTRKRAVLLALLWFVTSFGASITLGMIRILEVLSGKEHSFTVNLGFSLAGLKGIVIAGFLMDRVNRTALLTANLFGATIALTVFSFFTLLLQNGFWYIFVSAWVFHFFLMASWVTVFVVTVENFPTSVRSTSLGICLCSGSLASILGCFVMRSLVVMDEDATMVLCLAGASFFVGMVASTSRVLENRTGQPLPDYEPQVGGCVLGRSQTAESLQSNQILVDSQA
jgi:MFS family permease